MVPRRGDAEVDAMRYEPLSRFPALRTHDVDELRQRLSGLFSVWSIDLGRGSQRSFEGRLNHRQMQDIGVSYARYGSTLMASLSHADFYLQGFPVRGCGSFVVDGAEGDVSPDHGIVCRLGVSVGRLHRGGHRQVSSHSHKP